MKKTSKKELLACKTKPTYIVPIKKRSEKIRSTRQKRRAFRGNVELKCTGKESYLPAEPPSFLHNYTQIDTYLYVRQNTRDQHNYFAKIENSTPHRETTLARPRPPPAESGEASNVRHDEQTAHRRVGMR